MGLTLKFLLWGIVIYYLYKFIFGVVVPVGKATNQMKNTVKQMQEEQQRQQQQSTQYQQQTQQKQQHTQADKGDYIEFEEIK